MNKSELNTPKGEALLLLVDTATTVCSVALARGEQIVDERFAEPSEGRAISSLIAPMVDEVLRPLRASGERLDALALSAGPGSYTGLRGGSALAKGLCFGMQIPMIAISTLELMAEGYREKLGVSDRAVRIYPMIDARRMEVYTAGFDAEGVRLSPDVPLVLSAATPLEGLDSYEHHFVGDGATKTEGLWQGFDYVVDGAFLPRASYMLRPALRAFERGNFVDLAYWTPAYLKEYVATVARNKVLAQLEGN